MHKLIPFASFPAFRLVPSEEHSFARFGPSALAVGLTFSLWPENLRNNTRKKHKEISEIITRTYTNLDYFFWILDSIVYSTQSANKI